MQAVSIEADRWGQQRRAWLSHSLLARGAPGGKRKVILALGETTEQSPLTIYSPPVPLPSTSQVEQRLEPAKRAAHNVHKRLQACLQGQSGADMDKRVVSGGLQEEGPEL